MNRDEILEKSREENKNGDERVRAVRSKRIVWAIVYVCVVALLILYSYTNHNRPIVSAVSDATTLFFVAMLGKDIYKYIVTKDKSLFYDIAFFLALTICNVIGIIMGIA